MSSQRTKGTARRGGKGSQQKSNLRRPMTSSAEPPTQIHHQPPKNFFRGRLIVGIDLGTTCDCVASAQILGPGSTFEVKRNDFSPDSYSSKRVPFSPTALYYHKEHHLPFTGTYVKHILKSSSNRKDFDSDRLYRLWKIMFHSHQNDEAIKEVQANIQRQLDAMGKTSYDLLHDWVEVKYEEIFQGLRRTYDLFDMLDIEMVIAVPPGRSTIIHEKVRNAFVQGRIKSDAVSLASEPASMFCSWVHESTKTQDWKVGQIYVVADGGGATCCLVRFRLDRLDPLGFTQLNASESIICGAETISGSFVRLAASKLRPDCPNRDWWLEKMRRTFDKHTKKSFGKFGQMGSIDSTACNIETNGDFIKFSYQEIATCFDPCVTKLIEGVKRQITKGPVNAIVLGGGLLENPYVRTMVEKTFSSVRVLMPTPDKAHVAKGAVRDRALGNFISSCSFTRCKAVGTYVEVTKELEDIPFMHNVNTWPGKDGKQYIYVAEFIAKQGDSGESLMGKTSSENLPEDARVRQLSGKKPDIAFTETIYTFNYNASPNEKWLAYCSNETWVNMNGLPVSPPEQSDTLTWNIEKDGGFEGGIKELDLKGTKRRQFRVLRYSVQMRFTELETKYWICVWSSAKMKARTGKAEAFRSYPKTCEALFTPHEISKSLAESFKFDDGDVPEPGPQDGSSQAKSERREDAEELQVPVSTSKADSQHTKSRPPPHGSPQSENSRGLLNGRVENHTRSGSGRPRKRRMLSLQANGLVSWDNLEPEILDSD